MPSECIALLRQSAGLGHPPAQCQLANFYDNGEMGLEKSEEEALKYWKKAAEGGHAFARHDLGCAEAGNDDVVAAMRNWRLSASAGFRASVEGVIECFEGGLLHHSDLSETLQAMYRSRGEMKSEDRDEYIEYLKKIGEYREEYDL